MHPLASGRRTVQAPGCRQRNRPLPQLPLLLQLAMVLLCVVQVVTLTPVQVDAHVAAVVR